VAPAPPASAPPAKKAAGALSRWPARRGLDAVRPCACAQVSPRRSPRRRCRSPPRRRRRRRRKVRAPGASAVAQDPNAPERAAAAPPARSGTRSGKRATEAPAAAAPAPAAAPKGARAAPQVLQDRALTTPDACAPRSRASAAQERRRRQVQGPGQGCGSACARVRAFWSAEREARCAASASAASQEDAFPQVITARVSLHRVFPCASLCDEKARRTRAQRARQMRSSIVRPVLYGWIPLVPLRHQFGRYSPVLYGWVLLQMPRMPRLFATVDS
jgi:hypothetical protein